MLKLTRKKNECIIINGNIRVTVISDRHGRVKLGIEAPENIEVWREEVYEKIKIRSSHK